MSQSKKVSLLAKPPDESAILARQAKALQEAINDAKKAEVKRASRIENAKRTEQEFLISRCNEERLADQERIANLMQDYKSIKSKFEAGELPSSRERNYTRNNTTDSSGVGAASNRFSGFQSNNDILFQKKIYERMDAHDKNFQRSQKPKYVETNEVEKLKLLQSRRQVLQKLVTIHKEELRAAGVPVNSIPGTTARYAGGSSISSGYTPSINSSSSSVSYATFASSSRPSILGGGRAQSASRAYNVPKLKLLGNT